MYVFAEPFPTVTTAKKSQIKFPDMPADIYTIEKKIKIKPAAWIIQIYLTPNSHTWKRWKQNYNIFWKEFENFFLTTMHTPFSTSIAIHKTLKECTLRMCWKTNYSRHSMRKILSLANKNIQFFFVDGISIVTISEHLKIY